MIFLDHDKIIRKKKSNLKKERQKLVSEQEKNCNLKKKGRESWNSKKNSNLNRTPFPTKWWDVNFGQNNVMLVIKDRPCWAYLEICQLLSGYSDKAIFCVYSDFTGPTVMNCTVQCLVLEEHQNFCWCCTTQRLGGGGWGVGDQIFFWGGGSNGVGDPGFPSKKSSFFWGGGGHY